MQGLLALLFFGIFAISVRAETPFRYHSPQEPAHVDPRLIQDAAGGFFYFNLFRSLYRLDSQLAPVGDLAEHCLTKALTIVCTLRKDARYSDGSSIKASHFVFAFRRLFSPVARNVDLLLSVKNARQILTEKKPVETLGVRAQDDRTLVIDLERQDNEFLLKLTSPVLAPLPSDPPSERSGYSKFPFSGPYAIHSWSSKGPIVLQPNRYYTRGSEHRPPVEILLIDQDSTARQLYDLGKLSFLRRVTTNEIPSLQGRPDFIFRPTLRFDYIGFGPQLKAFKNLRRALTRSLNFPEMQKLYHTPGIVGCPSLPVSFFKSRPCLKMNLPDARAAMAKVKKSNLPMLTLVYPSLLGSDADNGMVWLQAQWKKHLGLDIELQPREFGIFTKMLQTLPPPIFRKGFNLDRPTCIAALEIFTTGHPDNFIQFSDVLYDGMITQLRRSAIKRHPQQCTKALKYLLDQDLIIPLGELYFAMLASPTFTGWRHTPLNQLDLTELKPQVKRSDKKSDSESH